MFAPGTSWSPTGGYSGPPSAGWVQTKTGLMGLGFNTMGWDHGGSIGPSEKPGTVAIPINLQIPLNGLHQYATVDFAGWSLSTDDTPHSYISVCVLWSGTSPATVRAYCMEANFDANAPGLRLIRLDGTTPDPRTQHCWNVGIKDLKVYLGRYVSRAAGGETIIVTERATPVAVLAPLSSGLTAVEVMRRNGRIRGHGAKPLGLHVKVQSDHGKNPNAEQFSGVAFRCSRSIVAVSVYRSFPDVRLSVYRDHVRPGLVTAC